MYIFLIIRSKSVSMFETMAYYFNLALAFQNLNILFTAFKLTTKPVIK